MFQVIFDGIFHTRQKEKNPGPFKESTVYQKRSDLVNRLVDGSVNTGQSKKDQKREVNKTHGQFSRELKVLEPVFFFFSKQTFFFPAILVEEYFVLCYIFFCQDSPTWRKKRLNGHRDSKSDLQLGCQKTCHSSIPLFFSRNYGSVIKKLRGVKFQGLVFLHRYFISASMFRLISHVLG